MGKNPAFQFYPSDWVRDLGPHPLEICGAWMNILCSLFWEGGRQTKTIDEWARVLRENRKKTEKIFKYLQEKNIANVERLDNQNITIISRRMVRDFAISQLRREVGKLGGNPALKKRDDILDNQTDNQNPTPSSSSSNTKNKYTLEFEEFWKAYPKHSCSKKEAFSQWGKATTKPSLEIILSALEKQKRAKKALMDAGQFTPEWPDAERWIKKARWDDEVDGDNKTVQRKPVRLPTHEEELRELHAM